MDDRTPPAEFDEQARDRIRRGLLRYMEEHRIGTPRLRERIMKADKRARELPLSNLQRFLANKHRTFDTYVGMCHEFLDSVGAPLTADEFAPMFLKFLGIPKQTKSVGRDPELMTKYVGSYSRHSYGQGKLSPRRVPAAPWGNQSGKLTLTPAGNEPYLVAVEFVDEPTVTNRVPEHRRALEGVAVTLGNSLCIFARDLLTRFPWSSTVIWALPSDPPGAPEIVEGTCYGPLPDRVENIQLGLSSMLRVQYLPEAPEETT